MVCARGAPALRARMGARLRSGPPLALPGSLDVGKVVAHARRSETRRPVFLSTDRYRLARRGRLARQYFRGSGSYASLGRRESRQVRDPFIRIHHDGLVARRAVALDSTSPKRGRWRWTRSVSATDPTSSAAGSPPCRADERAGRPRVLASETSASREPIPVGGIKNWDDEFPTSERARRTLPPPSDGKRAGGLRSGAARLCARGAEEPPERTQRGAFQRPRPQANSWAGPRPKREAQRPERKKVVRPAGVEPATLGFEARYSIQLSYGRPLRREVSTYG